MEYRITPRARDDLLNIGRYTERQWDKSQRTRYLKKLEKRFEWLAENPRAGRQRNEIHKGFYSFHEGRHVIFYLISETGIDIIGIPHKEMDVLNYFND